MTLPTPERLNALCEKAAEELTHDEVQEIADAFRELDRAIVVVVTPAIRRAAREYNRMLTEAVNNFLTSLREGRVLPSLAMTDQFAPGHSPGDGCWADVWIPEINDYDTCNDTPDPVSTVGLCTHHQAKLSAIR